MKKNIIYALLIFVLMTQSGCSLLEPILKAPFTLVGEVLKIVNKLPKPPPGVFF